ncbi:helix-turn-helix transcriptional regulator [Parapedobacter indicus]|uniref:AraC-type DNA-binding protein n=1 Tax=Parapedobacter indicus TaxID=1477437 RepID=A0A1I3TGR1_9SPHI|nr:helix-turn-helix transcriptional regulator [Parapedobacter indicus]PPK99505.1 AraC-like DNA-binding protein [Parapedobacter indicus]SFJ69703.1 AraC-type DNA-binding protein [Parapedobacter indicus]
MIKSITFDLYPRYFTLPNRGRLPFGVRYRLHHAERASWQHPEFWMAEQYHNGKHAYAALVEIDTDIRLALSAKAVHPDLLWLYQLEGALRIAPDGDGPPTRYLSLKEGQYAPLFAGTGDYIITVSPGRHRLLLLAAQLNWVKRYADTGFAPIQHLLSGPETGFVTGEPQPIHIRHLRCLFRLQQITGTPGFRQDVTLYDYLADLFYLYLAEISSTEKDPSIDTPEENVAEISRYLQREVIKGNVPTLADLAEQFGYTEKTLIRHFKRVLSDTPSQYIYRIRMVEAERLLAMEGLPPTPVAYQLGYEHFRTFERAFKRYYGKTPGEVYRNGKQ